MQTVFSFHSHLFCKEELNKILIMMQFLISNLTFTYPLTFIIYCMGCEVLCFETSGTIHVCMYKHRQTKTHVRTHARAVFTIPAE